MYSLTNSLVNGFPIKDTGPFTASMIYSAGASFGSCASAWSLIFTIKGQTPDFAGISPNTFKMNWTSFVSKFRFMLDPMANLGQSQDSSAKQC